MAVSWITATITAGTFSVRCILASLLLALAAVPSAYANPSLLFDLASGKVLYHEDAFRRWYPASLTKLMTAYVTFRAIDAGELQPDSPIKVTRHSAAEPPSKMGYKPGSVMTLDNALKMMLIKSANDIAMAVGENVGGSEEAFVKRMNAEAKRLGMADTHYVNPNGLHSPAQYTSAHDLALLVTAIRKQYPQYAHYFSIEGLSAGKKVLMSYNLLVGRMPGADGMKTGFICSSGFNMIGSATRNGRTLVSIVLGRKTGVERAEAAAALLERGFLTEALQTAANSKVDYSTIATLPFYGVANQPPKDMREEICGKKPEQSEDANVAGAPKSQWLEKIAHPKLVAVGLGGATGPIPLARRGLNGAEYADVPVPTPRPDYAPAAAETAQGDVSAGD
jgi:D-alanyl-D-alanine carboxypeptidase